MQRNSDNRLSRRAFVKSATAAAATAATFPHVLRGAPADKPLTIGLVGCGGRGTGAAKNAMEADPNVKVVALADIVQGRIDQCIEKLKEMTQVDPKNCFLGFDAYKKVLELDVDYVILATPPYYRPEHLTACIKAGKHVFTEKPVAVDPVGIRAVIAAGAEADNKGLSIVAGTQRRHQKSYVDMIKRLHAGAIGKIVSGQCYWNMGNLWYRKREPDETDLMYMHRDWVNWAWLSGDHVVEQHVHNLDVISWALKCYPRKIVAFGSRQRRMTGDQYDNFSADLHYPDADHPDDPAYDIHVHSMCRQIKGCANNVSERMIGQVGLCHTDKGCQISNFGEVPGSDVSPYVQEHIDLIKAIRTGQRLNEAERVAHSTLIAIMIRESAYSGKALVWDEFIKSDLKLTPPDYDIKDEEKVRDMVPVPGLSPE